MHVVCNSNKCSSGTRLGILLALDFLGEIMVWSAKFLAYR